MIRHCYLPLLVAALAGNCPADEFTLVSRNGNLRQYVAVSNGYTAQLTDSTPVAPGAPLAWQEALKQRVTAGEKLRRSSPPDDADQLARSEFESAINQKVFALVDDLPGRQIDVTFVVQSVIERKPPVAPAPLAGNASEPMRQSHARRVEAYARAVEAYKRSRYCVTGRVQWQQPFAEMPMSMRAELNGLALEERRNRTFAWRDQRPHHFVAFHADAQTVEGLTPGQVRRVTGRITLAALQWFEPRTRLPYGPNAGRDARYVTLDAYLSPATIAEPQPASGGSGGAEALLKLARLYIEAEKPALARQQLQRVVAEHPGTEAAEEAQRLLAELAPD